MARQSRKLSALEVSRLKDPGVYPVGESLYLQVSKNGSKSWLFRYALAGKTTWMGLGPAKVVPLIDARAKVIELQKDLLNGINPLSKRIASERDQRLLDAQKITFDECAARFIEAHRPGWKNTKHASQWENTLETYAFPFIGHLAAQDIDTALVLKVLEPIWFTKPETASRLRGRLERILSWGSARGYRGVENPARWRGHLDQLLPKRSSIQKVEHFEALPFTEVGAFLERLKPQNSIGALALEFVILTATRTNEALGARWEEFNLDQNYWLIPAERMKAGKQHKVPLSERVIEILRFARSQSSGEFVFQGSRNGRPLSNMALLMIIRRLGYKVTTHGFRSSFSDWAAEKTNFPREVVEMALAHTIKNKVEAAYRRGDLLEKRRSLMSEWAQHCNSVQKPNGQLIDFSPYQVSGGIH